MTKMFCDICGKEITNYSQASDFKIKKRVHSWYEAWWERLTVHKSCWIDLCETIKKEKENG